MVSLLLGSSESAPSLCGSAGDQYIPVGELIISINSWLLASPSATVASYCVPGLPLITGPAGRRLLIGSGRVKGQKFGTVSLLLQNNSDFHI